MTRNSFFEGMLSVMIALTTFSSCEKRENNNLPPETITVMKLKKPEYKDFIIAYQTGDSFKVYRGNKYNEPIGKSSYSPYWELSGDWLLVDWKWQNFPFPALGGAVLLENERWEKLTSVLQTWPLTAPHVSQPIEQVYHIKASSLADFLGKTYAQDVIALVMNRPSIEGCNQQEKDAVVQKMDEIWTVFQTDMTTVIEKGELEKLSKSAE